MSPTSPTSRNTKISNILPDPSRPWTPRDDQNSFSWHPKRPVPIALNQLQRLFIGNKTLRIDCCITWTSVVVIVAVQGLQYDAACNKPGSFLSPRCPNEGVIQILSADYAIFTRSQVISNNCRPDIERDCRISITKEDNYYKAITGSCSGQFHCDVEAKGLENVRCNGVYSGRPTTDYVIVYYDCLSIVTRTGRHNKFICWNGTVIFLCVCISIYNNNINISNTLIVR